MGVGLAREAPRYREVAAEVRVGVDPPPGLASKQHGAAVALLRNCCSVCAHHENHRLRRHPAHAHAPL